MLELNHYISKEFNSLIERFTIAKTYNKAFNLMFIPTHYVTLFFPLHNSVFYYDSEKYSEPIVKNLLLKPAYLHIPKNSHILGIRFYPFGMYPFSDSSFISATFNADEGDKKLIEQIEISLRATYQKKKEEEVTLLKEFYTYLLTSQENSTINDFCVKKQMNYMHVYRFFRKILDISPKRFERLIKFRLAVENMIIKKEKLTVASFDSGYYDQAHFIKEFRYWVGMTPSEYRKYLSDNNLFTFNDFTDFTSLRL